MVTPNERRVGFFLRKERRMSKKNKYFKWIGSYDTGYIYLVRQVWKIGIEYYLRYDKSVGNCRVWETLCNHTDAWKEIPYSEFRKLKSELLKGKRA